MIQGNGADKETNLPAPVDEIQKRDEFFYYYPTALVQVREQRTCSSCKAQITVSTLDILIEYTHHFDETPKRHRNYTDVLVPHSIPQLPQKIKTVQITTQSCASCFIETSLPVERPPFRFEILGPRTRPVLSL